ncbi:hypothetical protein H648_34933gpHYPp1 [Human mastadenovirus C]|uniref:Uncharacterized protein n=1 Tax=Human mastadenovirus C TaxID=129951 RepID=T1UEX9_9ADEN|nr:hypothetical protein H648_34933gpHYPp1 [Human mastadenovirus C]
MGETWFLTPNGQSSPGSWNARPSAGTAARMPTPRNRYFSRPSSTPLKVCTAPRAAPPPRASCAPRATPRRGWTMTPWSNATWPTRRAKTGSASAPAGPASSAPWPARSPERTPSP